MIQVGQKIDDFEFEYYQNLDIKKRKFSDLRGKWVVLLFYPADFTFVCPTELEEAAERYDEFKKEGAEILSVSTDTAYVHKAGTTNPRRSAKYSSHDCRSGGKTLPIFWHVYGREGIVSEGHFYH